jgi:hypothetical protein
VLALRKKRVRHLWIGAKYRVVALCPCVTIVTSALYLARLEFVTSWQRPAILVPSSMSFETLQFQITVFKVGKASVCHSLTAIGRVDIGLATLRCQPTEEKQVHSFCKDSRVGVVE